MDYFYFTVCENSNLRFHEIAGKKHRIVGDTDNGTVLAQLLKFTSLVSH
jgi:hypothetical protein